MSVCIIPKIINNCAVFGKNNLGEVVESSIKHVSKGSFVYGKYCLIKGISLTSQASEKYLKLLYNSITLAPELNLNYSHVVTNLKRYADTLICVLTTVKLNYGENVVLISPKKDHELLEPFVYWFVRLSLSPLVYCIAENEGDIENIQQDVMDKTSNIGVPCVIIFPYGEYDRISQSGLMRMSLSILGIGGKFISFQRLKKIDSLEIDCIFSKNLNIAFFNSEVIWKSGSHSKVCQYAIKESLDYLIKN